MQKEKSDQDVITLGLGVFMSVPLGIAYEWLRISVLRMALCWAWFLLGIVLQWLSMVLLGMTLHQEFSELGMVNAPIITCVEMDFCGLGGLGRCGNIILNGWELIVVVMAICDQGSFWRCGNDLSRLQGLYWERMFVAKEVLCMGRNGLCGSKQIVFYIKRRKFWVCGRNGESNQQTREKRPISCHVMFSSLN